MYILKIAGLSALVAASVVGVGGYVYMTALRDAEVLKIKTEHAQALTIETEKVRSLENANNKRVIKSSQGYATKTAKAAVDSAAAGDAVAELRLLLGAATTHAGSAESAAAAAEVRADLYADMLGNCAARYIALAKAADRADISAATLSDSWPINLAEHEKIVEIKK